MSLLSRFKTNPARASASAQLIDSDLQLELEPAPSRSGKEGAVEAVALPSGLVATAVIPCTTPTATAQAHSCPSPQYEVFAYSPSIYSRIKEVMKVRGVQALSAEEINSYFSPWYAEHMGRILAASGNSTLEAWADDNLRTQFYFFVYSSLIKLHHPESSALLKDLDKLLGNEALLQLDLRTLAPVFKDPVKRLWFEEVIDNNLKLWEVNMR